MKNAKQGLFWCTLFVVLDAAQAVFLGGVLQTVDSFFLGLIAFGASSLFCAVVVLLREPAQFVTAFKDPFALVGINVTVAVGWILYFAAVQRIEPAIAFALFSGAIPLTTVTAALLKVRWSDLPTNSWEWLGLSVLTTGLTVLAVITVTGESGFVRGGSVVAAAGVSLSLLAGIFIGGMLLFGQRLDSRGIGPTAQFALRFPLFTVMAGCGCLLGLDVKEPVSGLNLALAIIGGLIFLSLPIYAVQKAVATSTAMTIGLAASLTPLLVYLFQIPEGRVVVSDATAVGLLVYFAGAVIASAARAALYRKSRTTRLPAAR